MEAVLPEPSSWMHDSEETLVYRLAFKLDRDYPNESRSFSERNWTDEFTEVTTVNNLNSGFQTLRLRQLERASRTKVN